MSTALDTSDVLYTLPAAPLGARATGANLWTIVSYPDGAARKVVMRTIQRDSWSSVAPARVDWLAVHRWCHRRRDSEHVGENTTGFYLEYDQHAPTGYPTAAQQMPSPVPPSWSTIRATLDQTFSRVKA